MAARAPRPVSRLRRDWRLTPQRVNEVVHVHPVRVERQSVDEEGGRFGHARAAGTFGLSQHARAHRARRKVLGDELTCQERMRKWLKPEGATAKLISVKK